jgi:hypothetical protein
MARAVPGEAVCWVSTAASKDVRVGPFPEDIAGVESRSRRPSRCGKGCLTEEPEAV